VTGRRRSARYGFWRPSKAAAIDLLHLQRVGLDAVEAAHINGHHVSAVARPFATGKRLDAAGRAKQVVDDVLVELIVGQIVFAGDKLEITGRRKGQQ